MGKNRTAFEKEGIILNKGRVFNKTRVFFKRETISLLFQLVKNPGRILALLSRHVIIHLVGLHSMKHHKTL